MAVPSRRPMPSPDQAAGTGEAGRRSGPDLADLIAGADARCSGRLGVVARRLGTDEELLWHGEDQFRTASTIKIAIHAALMAGVSAGRIDLGLRVPLRLSDLTGGSGVLSVLRPGIEPTVADLCTLMITISDNTATNMVIDLLGGVDAINETLHSLGFGEIVLHRRLPWAPPPLVAGPRPPFPGPVGPFGTATPATLCRLVSDIKSRRLIDEAASRHLMATLEHQQIHTGVPRAFLKLSPPGQTPDKWPGVANKTGAIEGCRADVGLLELPGGPIIAYAVMADDLSDETMTPLSEGDELMGRVGAALLRRWWQGPGPAPLRPGWPE
ncbi:MAG TPA: serine hydrolase [Acidimicrobiales bacterium]|nr:serine hydrolase [Acidimicrobiales bacterium]